MKTKIKDAMYPVVFAIAFLILWELIVRLFDIPFICFHLPQASYL